MFKTLLIFTSLVLVMLPGLALSQNLVTNPGFETGNFSGWTTTPAPSGSLFYVGGNPHSGTYAAQFGAVGSSDDSISQALSTSPGQPYNLTFWLYHGSTNNQNDFHVSWGGSSLLDLINVASFGYTEYSYNVVASGSSTNLAFSGREVPSWYYLDDISVTTRAPEPTTIILLGFGLLGLWGFRKKFKK